MQTSMDDRAMSGLSLDVEAAPILSYAMAHNRIPIVNRITIHNPGATIRNATLGVQVSDAAGPIGHAQELVVDLEAGAPTVLTDVRLTVDAAAMLQVEEQRPATLRVWLQDGDALLAERQTAIQLLAAQQWLAVPTVLSLELLAAFVMPNHPAVAALVSDAADLLAGRTGSPSMEGYQSGAARVDQIVQAIYEAMQSRSIRYANPPASWADVGQKIRTPDEVLVGRVGTCLDTVVVMAAALEQAGVRPLLWIMEDHAFLGYWRGETALDAVAQTDVADVVNRIDLGQIGLVETTALVVGERPIPFNEAHQSPYAKYLTGSLAHVVGVTDVWRARRNHIVPLPARVRESDGTVNVFEYHPLTNVWAPPSGDAQALQAGSATRTTATVAEPEPARVQQWKNALLDLSLRNRLINFPERTSIAIAVPERRLGALEDAINEGTAINLVPADQIAEIQQHRGIRFGSDLPQDQLAELLAGRRSVFVNVSKATYETRMRNLAYKARTIIEETGANNLYLALGSLVWRYEDRDLRSPLILVPVRLASASRHTAYRISLDESGSSTPNYCLLEKLRQVHGLTVPAMAAPVEDAAGIDLDASMRAMREALVTSGLAFRIEDTADLAILQFAKFRLWKDLDDHWGILTQNSLVRHLVEAPNDAFVDPVTAPASPSDLDELAAACPVAADASQLAAVGEAVAGRSFVLEGPPGTGKSQTITNLLTRAVAEGQRVLFIAEKRAALDVVKTRLDAVGMGPFSLDLHDKSSKPAEVRSQIRQALDYRVDVDDQGLALELESLRSSRRVLSRYTQRLHESNGAGLSFYSARTAELASGDTISALPVPVELLDRADAAVTISAIRRHLAELADVADPVRPRPDHPWAFIDTGDTATFDTDAIRQAAARFDEAVMHLPSSGPIGEALLAVRTADDLAALAALLAAAPVTLAVLDETRTTPWEHATRALIAEISLFRAASHPGLDVVTAMALDLPLTEIHNQAMIAQQSGLFGRRKRLIAVRDRLHGVLLAGADVPPKEVPILTAALLELQGAIRNLATRVISVPGLTLPAAWNPLTDEGGELVDRQVQWLRWAGSVVDAREDHPANLRFASSVRAVVAAQSPPDRLTVTSVGLAATSAQSLAATARLTADGMSRWSGEAGLLGRWSMTRAGRELGSANSLVLSRWLALLTELEPLRAAGLDNARAALLFGHVDADDAVRAFDLGLAEASVTERRMTQGLDSFDADSQGRNIGRFIASSASVRQLMTAAIPRQVLDGRSFDASAARGQIGALHRELAKQRRGLGVRSLLHSYGELITQVMPCVLVSPDSLARFFPVSAGLFDLVVFDEASQIRVADAVGAMGRAKAVVVVGDSKQMPPTSFGEPTSGFDGDDRDDTQSETVEDEESILSECVQARVPRQWLSWHYRSQDESLIAFSNQQYYENRLSSFPAPTDATATTAGSGLGVSLVRVDGVFHRSAKDGPISTNPIEAAAIVAEIQRRFAASPDVVPSIGVVTFNIQQRTHIEALIHGTGDERIIDSLDRTNGEGLFIKNLENVQGDERDVILFSTAFSVNARGQLPLNFGPLNRDGGERRLNVAITRARRQVIVFSSFDPEQLRADETASVGIKHLRAYLDMAKLGTSVLPRDSRKASAIDRHREQIAEAVRHQGFEVHTDVGLSEFKIDLSVALASAPDRPVMAVLLDGPAWAARRTVGDRDGLPVEVLSHLLHWPAVERVWLPAWLDDPSAVLAQLVANANSAALVPAASAVSPALSTEASSTGASSTGASSRSSTGASSRSSAGASSGSSAGASSSSSVQRSPALSPPEIGQPLFAPPSGPVAGTPEGTPTAMPSGRLDFEVDFVPWSTGHLGGVEVLDGLPAGQAAHRVTAALVQAVEAEGPIHIDRLARLVARAFGLSRLAENRKSDILRELPAAVKPQAGEPFVWPSAALPGEWRTFRRSDADDERPLEHISLYEIVNAMASLCAGVAGISRSELKREALSVFGGKRVTTGLDERLNAAISLGLQTNRLVEQANGLLITTER